ncbi:MAG: membrane protein insertase YidC [Paludibacteraceae bacterium]|nr:membrane protein insertase YidC [Paludibacteraceae bacterium]
MDKNTWIGFGLIAVIFVGFSLLNKPSKEQLAQQQAYADSIAAVQQAEAEQAAAIQATDQAAEAAPAETATADSLGAAEREEQLRQSKYDVFSRAATPRMPEDYILENEVLRLHISDKGARIHQAELKQYKAYGDSVNPLCLFRGDESEMRLLLRSRDNSRILATDELHFALQSRTDTTLVLRLMTDSATEWLDVCYAIHPNNYMVDITLQGHGLEQALAPNTTSLELVWNQLVPQHERGRKFEERYAQLQYMLPDGDMEKLSESKQDDKSENAKIRWIAYKDQFFSSVLIADSAFETTTVQSTPQKDRYIKAYMTNTHVPFDIRGERATGLKMYLGPNHYNTLKAFDAELEGDQRLRLKELVPLGWKIVSWINKALVIPMFDLFNSWQLNIGLVILLMTLVIKLIILPFVFASYRSSAKMRVLKPQIDEINAKYPPEKMQERQQETMKLYQRAGVSPMSGCLPMLFQLPVLMAMFWFLPTAIELRGKAFLWADDLSTYDAVITWGTNIPLLGDHLSLFCLLMTIVNIVYTYMNMQQQAMDPNMKFMKYMMYAMPLMFLFIFNDYNAGLSYYYFVSLLITILQTMIFRWCTDDKKLLAEMEKNAKKNEKKAQKRSGFMARLEEMQRQQQKMAREQAKAQQKRMR